MGYDPLLNLVLDNTVEYLKGELQVKKKNAQDRKASGMSHVMIWVIDLETGYVTEKTRELGLAVLRGTAVILISPFDGTEEIENPFVTQ